MQTIPSSEKPAAISVAQLFSYPFRIFFLSMALQALAVIPLWVLQVTGTIQLPLALPGLFWHQHEMLFGFLSAAVAGFLLTAVCVWTQTERTHGLALVLLWGVWLAGRLLITFGAALPEWLVLGVNLAFLPLVMVDAGRRIWQARQRRQLLLLVVIGLLWLMQAGFLLRLDPAYGYGALIMALALISVIGGRITPAFTAGWLRQRGQDNKVKMIPALDLANLFTMVALLVTLVAGLHTAAAVLALVSAGLMLARLFNWKGWLVRQEPLLWILHLSILWVPVSLMLLAGSLLWSWPSSAWTHAAGTGAVGCLILGVVSRVALGHTGRPLVLPRGMVLAFVLIHLAALIRVATAFGLLPWHAGVGTSALFWLVAYGLFLIRYIRVLASPRPDGREG